MTHYAALATSKVTRKARPRCPYTGLRLRHLIVSVQGDLK